jgi:prevent-host-death family protein
MKSVGVRELKNRATQIVREVRVNRAEYIVTVGGEPVAVLKPYEEADDACPGCERYCGRTAGPR